MTLTLNDAGAAMIQHFEGCAHRLPDGHLHAYADPGTGGAPWTIGWGSTGPDIHPDTVWTQAQCDARFARDSVHFAAELAKVIGAAPTSANQFAAMVCLAYNIGLANLAGSTLLRKHREGDHPGAALEFGRWNHANGRVLTGLTKRCAAERALYETDDGREDVARILQSIEGGN